MPTQTYSEIKHSLKAIQISKLELFQFSAISSAQAPSENFNK